MKDLIWKIRFWWDHRWFERNKHRIRNVAAWAVHHHAYGGSHDANTILDSAADKRIMQAAYGLINKKTNPNEWSSVRDERMVKAY